MSSFSEHSIIKLHDEEWYHQQKVAGKVVAECLQSSKDLVLSAKSVNLLDIEELCYNIILKHDCTPTFYQYKGAGPSPFPGKICLSVNRELVHGIPRDYVLQDGDVVKVDLGATYKSAIADAAITVIRGKAKDPKHIELVEVTKKSLDNAISFIQLGKQVGCIGNAIHHVIKKTRFGLITNYGGHGIGGVDDTGKVRPHASPFIHNKAQSNQGVRIQAGMSFAIEPLVCLGEAKTSVLTDGWTVACPDICAHFEHTIFMTDSGPEIMTKL